MEKTLEHYREKVFANIREEDLTKLVLDLCNIPSPYGYEKEAGDFVYDWMEKEGFMPKRVGITEDRFNVVGKLKGEGNGYNLLFSSHLDTTGPRGKDIDSWRIRDLSSPYWHSAWLEEGVFYGQGVENDKGPMACFLIAAKAIKDAGVPLKGDIYLTACPGEMGQEPVDEFAGLPFLSKEVGAEYMMVHGGIVADYGIAAEGTDFGISWVEAGKAFFKITIHGKTMYTPFVQHPEKLTDHKNPIVQAAPLIEALVEWSRDYEVRHRCSYKGGDVIPKVQIGAIKGGHPHYVIGGTDICSLYLDCRITPGTTPREIREELERVVRSVGIQADIELFLFRQGYEAEYEKVLPFVEKCKSAHQAVFETELQMADPVFSSMWRDHSVFNEYRVASVTYGPPRFKPKLADLMNCARVYAAIALEVCMAERT